MTIRLIREFSLFCPFYSTVRRGKFVRNRKGGINLLYGGFLYRKKAEYKNTTNWVCAKAPTRDTNNRLVLCYGRCVTEGGYCVRLSKKGHNHPPVDIEILDIKNEYYQEVDYGSFIIEPTDACDVEI